jgi:hypothetical protein
MQLRIIGRVQRWLGQQTVWTPHRRLLDCFEGVIYQQ